MVHMLNKTEGHLFTITLTTDVSAVAIALDENFRTWANLLLTCFYCQFVSSPERPSAFHFRRLKRLQE